MSFSMEELFKGVNKYSNLKAEESYVKHLIEGGVYNAIINDIENKEFILNVIELELISDIKTIRHVGNGNFMYHNKIWKNRNC